MTLEQAIMSGRVESPSYSVYGPPRPLNVRMLRRLGIPRRYWQATLDEVTGGPFREFVVRYVVNIRRALESGYGMVLNGKTGTGKSSIAAICLKQARRIGASGFFITSASYLKAVIQNVPFDESTSVAQRCIDVDLLVIDDLAKEVVNIGGKNDGSAAMLEALVKERCSNLRSTIITMNLIEEDLIKLYGESMVGMLREVAPLVHVTVGSKRTKDGIEKFICGKQ
jgi:DNA replication protein DnaC